MDLRRNPVYEALRVARRHFFRLRLAEGCMRTGASTRSWDGAGQKNTPRAGARSTLDALSSAHQGVALEASVIHILACRIFWITLPGGETAFRPGSGYPSRPAKPGYVVAHCRDHRRPRCLITLAPHVTVTPAVVHASSGASEHLLVAQANLAQSIAALKEAGAWVVGLESGRRGCHLSRCAWTGRWRWWWAVKGRHALPGARLL